MKQFNNFGSKKKICNKNYIKLQAIEAVNQIDKVSIFAVSFVVRQHPDRKRQAERQVD